MKHIRIIDPQTCRVLLSSCSVQEVTCSWFLTHSLLYFV